MRHVSRSPFSCHFAPRRVAARLATAAAGAACALLSPGLGWAAGIEYPDNGTIAIGRGGAHAANPEDGLAFQYNPAGLAQQTGLRVHLDSRLAWQSLRFDSATPNTPAVENSSKPFLAPSAAVSYGWRDLRGVDELTVAIGGTGPSAIGKSQFPKDGAQRYAIISTDYLIAYYSAAVSAGWKLGASRLRVGLTGQLVQGQAEFSQAVWSGFGTYDEGINKPTSTSFDTLATFSGTSGLIPALVAGVSFQPFEGLDLGASYRPKVEFDAPGTLKLELPKSAQDLGVSATSERSRLRLNLAGIARLGAAYKPLPRWRFAADVVWEQWSSFEEIRIVTQGIGLKSALTAQPVPLPDVVFPKHYRDAYSVRLGADHELLPKRLTVRAGYLFETSAIPKEYVSVDFAQWQRHALSVGASVKLGPMWLDAAVAHHFVATQDVSNSKVMSQVSPKLGDLPASVPSVVGNGQYDASLTLASLALRYELP